MKRICIGCGHIFEGKQGDLCPRPVGNDRSCGCLSGIAELVKTEVSKKAKAHKGARVNHGSN